MFGRLFSGREKKPDKEEFSTISQEMEDGSSVEMSAEIETVVSQEIEDDSSLHIATELTDEKETLHKVEITKKLLPLGEKLVKDYKIGDLFRVMQDVLASDLYLNSNAPPYFRIGGLVQKSDLRPLSVKKTRALLWQVCSEDEIEDLEASGAVEFTFEVNDLSRFRINIFKENNGYGGVFKKIPLQIQTFRNLSLPPIAKKIALYNRGLIIISGPSRSGKSNTIASIIDLINEERNALVMTIENPVEFIHESKNSIVIHREIGTNVFSYEDALEAILKEDPDVIFIGRDLNSPEIINLALKSAERGALVFGCLHLNSSQKVLKRLLSFFPSNRTRQLAKRLSAVLRAIIVQQLLPKSDSSGLCLAVELLLNSPEIAELIRNRKLDEIKPVLEKNKAIGMQSMESSIAELLEYEIISPEIAEEGGCTF